jgi:lipopolysaccharide/colanic/teichoic acid biosynthesis glycosyltransferase
MTSLAGAVQAVGSEDLLESLRVNSAAGFQTVNGTLVVPNLDTERSSIRRSDIAGLPAVSGFYIATKRVIDIVGSIFGLILLSPLLAVAAIVTKLSDGGPILYPHVRVGKWGREFKCFKFRTMVVNADNIKAEIAHLNTHDDHRTFKVPDDPRVTSIGRFLRRTSIDEMPQLWNVLRGDMSLVGPRPPVPAEVQYYDLDDMQRLMVKPGLTCIWQVSGRSRLPFPQQLEMDLEYIERRGLWFDTKLMLRTLPAVFSADGAY